MTLTLRPYIGGAFRPSAGDALLDDINPSDHSDLIARAPKGVPDDSEAAVAAASASLPSWRRLSGPARAEHLYRWAAAIHERSEDLAGAMSREVGKPIAEARGEVSRCITILRYYAGDAVREYGQVIPAAASSSLQYTRREALGVVALITPWNFPLAIPLWKAAPALAVGNTVVLKPSELSPHCAVLLAETATAAGIPAGVFNVVLGAGSEVGPALIGSAAVKAVSFTGSAATGASVSAAAAARNIRFQLEMGGKNVVIVHRDGDLDRAAALTAAGAMRYAGQKCTATSRVIVHSEVEREFLSRLQAQVEKLEIGPVDDPACAVGPMISAAARERVRSALESERAERIFGGSLPDDETFARGSYMAPEVVRLPDAGAPLAQRELFAPVLGVLVASELEEAIDMANATPFGLSASLFTRDVGTALEYTREIHAGLVRVNGDTTGVDPHAPFGGMKGSSSGSREQGPAAREFYTEIKTIQINP